MAQLSLCSLGPLQVTLDGRPVTGFKSNRVRALLIYLAVEAERPHPRETLAGLLWSDWPDREALSNLRYALSNLRRVIGDHDAEPPFLLISRDTLQFNVDSDHRLDVTEFLAQTGPAREDEGDPQAVSHVEEAVEFHQGLFLEGFSLSDSAGFEEWVQIKRQQIALELQSALRFLATSYERRGQYAQSHAWALRLLEFEPWDEVAQRTVMRSLALSGQRSAALVQYESYRQLLAEELGVEPTEKSKRLVEQIRSGQLLAQRQARPSQTERPVSLPSFLTVEPPQAESPPFVARGGELAKLDGYLNLTLDGRGRVAFVIGEAGSGKTSLAQAFIRQALEKHPELVVASGNCNAHTGVGDPYLPFREILALLTGDVESHWAAGALSKEHARRLWNALPLAAAALAESGSNLVDSFVPGAPLLERANAYAQGDNTKEWLIALNNLVTRRDPRLVEQIGLAIPSQQQAEIFEQVSRVLHAMARHSPLLLVVDDLQWADTGTINLLFHVGRQVARSSILILGAYRPEDVKLGRDDGRHPLSPVVNELRREFGDIVVDLNQAERRPFVEALLDTEPNDLRKDFREMLYQQTRGHPLFTSELLRGLQERGDLLQDEGGRWIEGPTLDWETLPARVEAVIAERIDRLDGPLRAEMRVASVEGEVFTAEVVARVRGIDERDLVNRLSSELDRRHRLVRAQTIKRLGSQRVSQYRFRNFLFQRYLYDSLDQVERAYLHEDVGSAMEDLYRDRVNEMESIGVQLAWHFQEAGLTEKAVRYLRQAGERALQLCAYPEATAHLTRGLELLNTLPDSPERARQELTLQQVLGLAGFASERGVQLGVQAFERARHLCELLGETSQLGQILGQWGTFHYVRSEFLRARKLSTEALRYSQQAGNPLLVAINHWRLGFTSFALGDYKAARAHIAHITSFYKPEQHGPFILLGGSNAGVSSVAYDAGCLWCLGYPDQAIEKSRKALALARELNHPFTLADVLCYAGCLFNSMRRDAQALKEHADELLQLVNARSMPTWKAEAIWHRGEALVMLGRVQEGMAQIREGIAYGRSTDVRLYFPRALGMLALGQAMAGRVEEGLATMAEALNLVEETGERHWEAGLHRLKGELLLMQNDDEAGEASLETAIEIACRQEAKSWELRATISLARLWQKQNKRDEARQMLGEIYGWFTEGFDTRDLKEAKALLEELS